MSKRRSGWRNIAGTPARRAWRRVERDGVGVLCVRLAGWAENSADGVSRVTDALDELAREVDDVAVSTLDVRGFCNASDDACGILTGVFAGVPCCWISSSWDQQGGQRWDLPRSEQLAPDGVTALERVVGWRRAGGLMTRSGDGVYTRDWRWSARGVEVQTTRAGVVDCADLYWRNRLVERVLPRGHGEATTRVLWPVDDPTGVAREAVRCGARLVLEGEQVVEVDLTRWATERALAEGWLSRIEGFTAVRELDVRTTTAREAEILRALAVWPALAVLRCEPGALGAAARAWIGRERPGLVLRDGS